MTDTRSVHCIDRARRSCCSTGVVAFAAALLSWGCDAPSEEADASSTGEMSQDPIAEGLLELGTFAQARTFVPYAQEGDVEAIEMGLQGGFHIFIDGRLRPEDAPSELIVQLDLAWSEGPRAGEQVTSIVHQRQPDIPDAMGWPTLPEMIVFIPDPDAVVDQRVDVSVRAEALDGVLLDTVEFTLDLIEE